MTVDERPSAPAAVGPRHPEREHGARDAVVREAYGDARPDEPLRPDTGADLGRRRFFRALGGETVRSAAAIAAAAGAIRRQAAETTGDLLGGVRADAGTASRPSEGGAPGARPPRFRSPYRVTEGALHLVDQRALPETISEVACRTSGDVIAAIRSKAVYGAPVVAQVAAYGVWLTASRASGRDPKAVETLLEGAANSLKEAVGRFRAAIAAVDRMEERRRSLPADGADVVEALRREADAIAMEAMFDHARLGRAGAELLRQPPERPLEILTLGSTGPLSAGMVGTGLGVIQAIAAEGRPVHVWVMETRPFLEGARITALELYHADIPHTVVADAAVGWVLANRTVDAVLVGADTIAANGATTWTVGSHATGAVAAHAGVPFHVCAPTSAVDPGLDGVRKLADRITDEADLASFRGTPLGPSRDRLLDPVADAIPGHLIQAFVTEEGALTAPFERALPAAVAARGRRSATPAEANR